MKRLEEVSEHRTHTRESHEGVVLANANAALVGVAPPELFVMVFGDQLAA